MGPQRPPPKRDTRALLYLRQSIAREESVSLEQQESACREHCRQHGYTVTEVIADPGLSGRKWDKRPGIQRAMTAIETHAADVIVCWKWSRISRRRLDFEIALDRAETAGGRIESATESIDATTASGRFARGMLAEVAAFESERIGEDWRATHHRRREKGLPPQGGRKFGYDVERDEATGKAIGYTINEGEAATLRWMYAMVIAGHGAPWIAAELNRRGITNRVGRTWPQVGVYTLLDSGFPAGKIVWRERDKAGNPKGDRIYYDGVHPPIISEQTWQKYRAARRRRSYQPARTVEARYPLSGLVYCADCGAPMWPTSGPKGGTGLGLVCSRWQSRGEGRCVTAVTRRVEEAVRDWLRALVDDVEAEAAIRASNEIQVARARRDESAARAKVTATEAKLTKLNRAWIEGMVPDVGYQQTRDEYLAEIAAAQQDIEAAQDDTLLRHAPTRDEVKTVVDEWDELAPIDLRNMLRGLVAGVIVVPSARRYKPGHVRVVPSWAADD